MNFSEALIAMKEGKKVRRQRWGYHGSNIYIAIKYPVQDADDINTEPYIYMYKEVDGVASIFPTPLSCESLLNNDWEIVS
jgi:hypothetical protein